MDRSFRNRGRVIFINTALLNFEGVAIISLVMYICFLMCIIDVFREALDFFRKRALTCLFSSVGFFSFLFLLNLRGIMGRESTHMLGSLRFHLLVNSIND